MAKQYSQKPRQIPPSVDTSIAIADVPVKIAFIQGDVTLNAYEDVIAVAFTPKTAAGREFAKRMSIQTVLDGQTTESALFTIASEAVKAQALETLQTLAQTDVVKRGS